MKLVRFGAPGREKPGIIDKDGKIRDLSKVVPDIAGETLSPKGLAKIKKADVSKLPVVKAGTRLGPCVGGTRHFVAIGLNYADHAAETGAPSVMGASPIGAFAGVHRPRSTLLPPIISGWQSRPMATRSSMSTVSSPGRRPLGKPARSPPATPKLLCEAAGVAGIPVFRRVISEAVTFDIWFTPAKPVRNAVTRSLRGKLLGAMLAKFVPSVWLTGARNSTSISAGSVGLVT